MTYFEKLATLYVCISFVCYTISAIANAYSLFRSVKIRTIEDRYEEDRKTLIGNFDRAECAIKEETRLRMYWRDKAEKLQIELLAIKCDEIKGTK